MTAVQVIPGHIRNVLDMPTHQLRLWSLKYTGQDIRVEGFVSSEDGNMMKKVTSDALIRRMTATLLFDRSGTFFELIGPIDHQFQQKSGMKKDLINEFSDGFPENWGLLLNRCSAVPKSIESTPPVTSSTRTTSSSSFVQPIQKEPIVTLADETNQVETKNTNEEDPVREQIDPANSTFRVPMNCQLDAVTPIRWDKNSKASKPSKHNVFEQTPPRSRLPLASSTPQQQQLPPPPPPAPFQQPQFAVPELPQFVAPVASIASLAAEIEDLFEETAAVRTPAALRKSSRPRFTDQTFQDISRRTYYPETLDQRNSTRYTVDSDRMARKRAYSPSRSYSSDEDMPPARHRRDKHDYQHSRNYDHEDISRRSRKDLDKSRQSTHSRSVRFESDDGYSRRRNDTSSELVESDREFRKLDKTEKELRQKLKDIQKQRARKHSSSSRKNSSHSETDKDLSMVWEKDNEQQLNDSIVEVRKSKTNGRFKEPKLKIKTEKKKAPPRRQKSPESEDDQPESPNVSQRRPVRSCRSTPLYEPPPKKIVWFKKDLDKLKRVIDTVKPSGSEEDWKQVQRLLNSRHTQVDWAGLKQVAIDKSLWKESTSSKKPENGVDGLEEEEEKKRRGAAAAVKEDKRLRDQMIGGQNKDILAQDVESLENIEPADISADESFLANTPVNFTQAVRRKGGKRKSLVPDVITDTPVRSVNSSVDQTPKPDATMAKDMETTMKYVHNLTRATAPGFRSNQSMLNNTTLRNNTTFGGRNTSMSVAKGVERATKMVRNDALDEEDEESISDASDDDEMLDNDQPVY